MIERMMFWTKYDMAGYLVMMGLSKTMNHIHQTTMEESQFFLIAKQVRDIWKKWGRPTPKTNSMKDSKWKVSIFIELFQIEFIEISVVYESWFIVF